jgi:hypothetical protein
MVPFARARWRRSSTGRSRSKGTRAGSLHPQQPMRLGEQNEGVATGIDGIRQARLLERGFQAAAPVGKIDVPGACRGKRAGRLDCLRFVNLVGTSKYTQARRRWRETPKPFPRRWQMWPRASLRCRPPRRNSWRRSRAVKSADVPRLARKTRGRWRVAARAQSDASRSRS